MEGSAYPAVPALVFQQEASTDTFFYDVGAPVTAGLIFVLQGIDIVAGVRDTSGHCFMNVNLNSVHLFHDSQSVGEGQGVYSSWRGAVPVFESQHIVVDCYSDIALNWSATLWGYVGYFDSGVPGFT